MAQQRDFNSTPTHHENNSGADSSDSKSPQIKKEALRAVYVNTQALYDNVNTNTLKNLEKMIKEVDLISEEGSSKEKFRDQAGVYLDSEIMNISSKLIRKCTYNLSKNISDYDPLEFADKIKIHLHSMSDTMRADECVWSLLGKEVISYFRRTPIYSPVAGTLQLMPKKERSGLVKSKDPVAVKKNPVQITIDDDETDDALQKTINEIMKVISKYQREHGKPLDLFNLILNPSDFGKTIENILHVSFLIRDGYVKITLDEEGIPQVQKIGKEERHQSRGKDKKITVQNIINLSMKQWSDLVHAYQISVPLIK